MAVFVGCDLGTMGTKAAVVDLDGRILSDAFEEVGIHTPRPGVAEQDLTEIEASARRTIRRVLEKAGNPKVAGVAFSGQMSGIGAIDSEFRPATHFDSWLDSRCASQVREMAGHAARITELSGCPPTYSHAPKIRWWQTERGLEYGRVAKFVVPGAYVAGRLCGLDAEKAFIDRTYLHFTNLTDTRTGVWSDELIRLTGVERRVLPRIVEPFDLIGEVTPEAAAATGLPAGTPVAAGAGDQAAAALGAGVADPGQAFDSAGTASVFALCLDRFAPDVTHQTFMATHSVIPGIYQAVAFINGGGLALRWFRDELAQLRDDPDAYRKLDRLAESSEPGAGGLLWYPHFQGRVLPPDPAARGGWLGLTGGHHLGDMFRAILEGIACEYAEWARLMGELGGRPPEEARVLGGGARSRLWNQIKADILGIDWVPAQREECGVLGDALIAAAAAGHLTVGELAEVARSWQTTGERVRPRPDHHQRYRAHLTAYRELTKSAPQILGALAP